MDNFTHNEVEGQGKICFMFLCPPLSPSSSPRSLLIFLIRNPVSVTALVLFSSGVQHFIPKYKDMWSALEKISFHEQYLLFSLSVKASCLKKSILVMSPCWKTSDLSSDRGRQKQALHLLLLIIDFVGWNDNVCCQQILSAVASQIMTLTIDPWKCFILWYTCYHAKRLRLKLHVSDKKSGS